MKNIKVDITSEMAWKKTSQFIQEKYGKKIEFRFLSVKSGDSIETTHSFSMGDDLVVPLNYKHVDLGHVVVCRGATLGFEQQQETVDLIRFLIEPQAYNRMLKLKLSETSHLNIHVSEDPESSDTNVVPLFSNSPQIMPNEKNEDENQRKLISKFVHVKAKSAVSRHKVAYKIHEMTGTIVFLRLQDLTDGKTSVTHEMDLSDTTLYVDNIIDLNTNQLDLLEKLSRQNHKGNTCIVVGSSLDEDQIHHLKYSTHLKNDLIALAYDADRVPVSQQASEEILDLLFFNDGDMIS